MKTGKQNNFMLIIVAGTKTPTLGKILIFVWFYLNVQNYVYKILRLTVNLLLNFEGANSLTDEKSITKF